MAIGQILNRQFGWGAREWKYFAPFVKTLELYPISHCFDSWDMNHHGIFGIPRYNLPLGHSNGSKYGSVGPLKNYHLPNERKSSKNRISRRPHGRASGPITVFFERVFRVIDHIYEIRKVVCQCQKSSSNEYFECRLEISPCHPIGKKLLMQKLGNLIT